MAVFPFLSITEVKVAQSLPLYKEWAFDFDNGCLLLSDGRMTLLSGLPALKVWMYKAICTAKARYKAYSAAFGSELESLIGTNYSASAAKMEAERMVTEALLSSPYILGISDVTVSFQDGLLLVSCSVSTVYGSDALEVTT